MMGTRQSPARRVALAGVVGALYVVLSLLVTPLAYGPLQFRLGEGTLQLRRNHRRPLGSEGYLFRRGGRSQPGQWRMRWRGRCDHRSRGISAIVTAGGGRIQPGETGGIGMLTISP